ncbi:MAG: hypothetical protein DRQ88_07045 [Epsilonproteobacteria bacterium]|nr:MAG: hypothetical protein DRQ89_08770 [Campylobacterota bacterium]RLA66312.1 MAG: hypothetical protein DRQ88_07045 [Campylobacterota bacterium]
MKLLTLLVMLLAIEVKAETFENLYNEKADDGFNDSELVTLFNALLETPNPKTHVNSFIKAVNTPFLPENAHTGDRFYKALSWYNDTTKGNRDGKFNLDELSSAFQAEVQKYLTITQSRTNIEARIAAWKMIQKLGLLKNQIEARGERGEGYFYPYTPKKMFEIDHNNPWNAAHTIDSDVEFRRDVIDASFTKPVLVKFGLTYCVHCLLLENLGSVPAVEKRYRDSIDVHKLWWNPKSEDYSELNNIAKREGVKSSPYFILYKDGKKINEGYAFPDDQGEGMEEFLVLAL